MIPDNIKEKIELIVKQQGKKSTAPDKDFPTWMESDIRNGAIAAYQLAQEELKEKWVHQFANEEAFQKFLKQERELTKKDEKYNYVDFYLWLQHNGYEISEKRNYVYLAGKNYLITDVCKEYLFQSSTTK